MRVIVAGSRDFADYGYLRNALDRILDPTDDVEFVSGDCRGADRLGIRYADEHQIYLRHFPADWDKYGRAAGPMRNRAMARYAAEDHGMLIAFWDGVSRGTKNMIEEAKKAGLKVYVYTGGAEN